MFEMTKRVRLEVLVDAPLAQMVSKIAKDQGITGYTVLRATSGFGTAGGWREDLISGADAKVIFLIIASSEKADSLLHALEPLLESHGLVVLRSIVEVIRPDRF